MPTWLLVLGGGAILAYLVAKARAPSLAIGQTAYLTTTTNLNVGGVSVPLQAGTRVYVQTTDASGTTEIRTDSGNVGTVPTSSIVATLPAGVTMQVN